MLNSFPQAIQMDKIGRSRHIAVAADFKSCVIVKDDVPPAVAKGTSSKQQGIGYWDCGPTCI
jgi:hypothetical protein